MKLRFFFILVLFIMSLKEALSYITLADLYQKLLLKNCR